MRSAGDISITATLLGFARTLRAAGVDADPGRVQRWIEALGHLDVLDVRQVYWSGRVTLCGGLDDLPRYDRCFAGYFGGRVPAGPPARITVAVQRPMALPEADDTAGEDASDDEPRTSAASPVEILRQRDVTTLTAAQRAEVDRMLAALRAGAIPRRTRRYAPAHHGALDRSRTVRDMLARGGETAVLRRRAHTRRPRRVVLLIDVSGSMAPYADALLRFAHAAVRSDRRCEAFTVGTRLTRVTTQLRHRDADTALATASQAIPDYSGGTRLGDELKEFLDGYGQRGAARGAVVVIASDGWERGDVQVLATQMARLARLAYRVIWVNPHKAQPGYEPLAAGMAAALPYVDDFMEGHSLGALEELAALIGGHAAGHDGGPRARGARRA